MSNVGAAPPCTRAELHEIHVDEYYSRHYAPRWDFTPQQLAALTLLPDLRHLRLSVGRLNHLPGPRARRWLETEPRTRRRRYGVLICAVVGRQPALPRECALEIRTEIYAVFDGAAEWSHTGIGVGGAVHVTLTFRQLESRSWLLAETVEKEEMW